MTSAKIAVIGGDGIGPEVTAEAIKVLTAVAPDTFEFVDYDLGAERWLRTGEVLPDSVLEELKHVDAIALGAVGAAPGSKAIPSGLLERGLLLKLRFAFDHAINLRPSILYPGVPTPLAPGVVEGRTVDFVVVREGTEGLYCGNGGAVRVGTAQELATEVSVNTYFGVERVVRDAFRRAQARRGKLTLLHKHNVLVNAGRLWNRAFTEIAAEFPDVTTNYLHIDAAMIAMVVDPSQFDVIVTDAPYGVMHGSSTDVRGVSGRRDRSPAGLLREAVPVWTSQLMHGGALGIAWNTFGLSRDDLAEILSRSGLVVCEGGAWERFAHRVDSSIRRDLIVAVRP